MCFLPQNQELIVAALFYWKFSNLKSLDSFLFRVDIQTLLNCTSHMAVRFLQFQSNYHS